jgi:hypothetical protein
MMRRKIYGDINDRALLERKICQNVLLMLTWSEKDKKGNNTPVTFERVARQACGDNRKNPKPRVKCDKSGQTSIPYRWEMDDPVGGGGMLITEQPFGSVHDVVSASGFEEGRQYKAVRVRAEY